MNDFFTWEPSGIFAHVESLVRAQVQLCCQLISNELSHYVEFNKPQGGMELWLKFKESDWLAGVIHKANTFGLRLIGMPCFRNESLKQGAFRFGFASLNEQELEFAVEILKKITFTKT